MIAPDQDILANDFIYKSERQATKADDEGRVPKLEENGYLAHAFLNFPIGDVTYNENGDMATFVDTRSTPNITYTVTYAGDLPTSITDGTTTWTITWSDDRIISISQTG
jgi:hypothetical protein